MLTRRKLFGGALALLPMPALAQQTPDIKREITDTPTPGALNAFAVTTRSYNNSRTGANLQEKVLNVASVTQRGIAKKYVLQMQGDARGSEAQTLIVPNVVMADGLPHDLAIQASMSGAVFCFDANNGQLLWMRDYCKPVIGTPQFDEFLINQNWGILSTPVVDLAAGIIYFTSWSSTDGTANTAKFMAHAAHVVDGSDAAPAVDLSTASYNPGHGLATMTLGTIARKQRTGLLLTTVQGQQVIIAAFAAGAESAATNHGWVVALSTKPFRVTAGWNNSPHWQGGGIWMGSQAPAADADGNIYLIAGNGAFDGVTDFGECFTKLKYTPPASDTAMGSLQCVDWWTPFTDAGRAGINPATAFEHAPGERTNRPSNSMLFMPQRGMHSMVSIQPPPGNAQPPKDAAPVNNPATNPVLTSEWADQDLGSAGALLIPEFNLICGAGKDGILYVLDANNMGKTPLSTFAVPTGIQANYNKAKSINWFTYFPGWNISPAPTDLTKLNFFFANRTHHQHGTPIYYNSGKHGPMLFTCGENSSVRVWSINSQGQLTFLAYSDEYASPNAPVPYGGMPGAMMTLCANGQTAGTALLIACFPYGNANSEVTPGFFVVYDAENFSARGDGSQRLMPLWKSSDWGINYNHCKFNVPVVSGGKLFIPTYDDQVLVFQLT